MRSVPLPFFFALALVFTCFGSILFPFFPLSPFAPFLAIVYYTTPFLKAIWISVGCGLILDLLSSEFHFGLHALTLAISSALLFHQKKHFFEDKPLAFILFTTAISSVSICLQAILAYLFDRGIPLSWTSFFTDMILLPFVDGLYGFLWFIYPMRFYTYLRNRK